MLAGCGVSLMASLVGAVPVFRSQARTTKPTLAMTPHLAAILLRMATVAALAVVVVLRGRYQTVPFLLWVAISYLAFLPIDVLLSHRILKSTHDRPGHGS